MSNAATSGKLRIIVIGAHPDDCEYKAGGVAALYRQQGHVVRFVSVTNGDAGHQTLRGPELANIRAKEALASGAVCGVEYEILDNHDGQLEPSIANRFQMIGLIRRFKPDLILTHRPNDYHPDHRVTAQLVCDAAYMVTVPAIVPEVPFLHVNPVIAYLCDEFQHPYVFNPSVVVDVGPVLPQIVDMHAAHASQFFEWLPYNQGVLDQVPADHAARKEWIADWIRGRLKKQADRFRSQLIAKYGPDRGAKVEYAEAFEGGEYGSPLTPEAISRLFPFN